MLISCFICLGGVSAYSFYCYFNPNEIETSGSETSFLITGLLFSFLSIYILGRGIILKHVAIKSKVQMDYSGDTNFLNILKKYGWKKEQIHLIAEPLIVLFIGFAYLFFNLIGGITIMVFAISVWARLLIEIIFLKNNVINKINTPSYNTIDRPKNHVS